MRAYLVHKLSARTTALLPLLMERLLNRRNPIAVPRQPSSVLARELRSCDRRHRRPYARPFSDGTGHKIEREAEGNSRHFAHALAVQQAGDKAKTFLHHRSLSPRHQHLRPKDQKCCPCVRYETSPMSRVGHPAGLPSPPKQPLRLRRPDGWQASRSRKLAKEDFKLSSSCASANRLLRKLRLGRRGLRWLGAAREA